MTTPWRRTLALLLLGLLTACSGLDLDRDPDPTPAPVLSVSPSPTPSPSPTTLTLPRAQTAYRSILSPTLVAMGGLSKALRSQDWRAVRKAAGSVAAREREFAAALLRHPWPPRPDATATRLSQAVSRHAVQFLQLSRAKDKAEVQRLVKRLRTPAELRSLLQTMRSQLRLASANPIPRQT